MLLALAASLMLEAMQEIDAGRFQDGRPALSGLV